MADFFKKYKYIIIAAAVIAAVLTSAFLAGGRDGIHTDDMAEEISSSVPYAENEFSTPQKAALSDETVSDAAHRVESSDMAVTFAPPQESKSATNSAVDDSLPAVQSPAAQSAPQDDNLLKCTVSISCRSAIENAHFLPAETAAIIPADGVILPPCSLSFEKGETAFDILNRACRENKIHLEFSSTPVYGSKYVEGIGNLYDFDCGSGSGWMYSVNDVFPAFGCSQYTVNDGDTVCFLYTCSNGADIGAENASG